MLTVLRMHWKITKLSALLVIMNINSSKMKKINTYLWQITAKTNLHVGNEDSTSYGIIDKAVQRDALTGLPCINASSLKGAINEFCCSEGMTSDDRKRIFGSDKKGDKNDFTKGQAVFYDAQILFLPVQDEKQLYKYDDYRALRLVQSVEYRRNRLWITKKMCRSYRM